jgi:hypothetical protein
VPMPQLPITEPQKPSSLFSRITTGDLLQIGLMVFGLVSFAVHIQDRQDETGRAMEAMKAEITRTQLDSKESAQTVEGKILAQLQAYHSDNDAFQRLTNDRLATIINMMQSATGHFNPHH